MGLPGHRRRHGDPLRGSIQAPAISLAGCAPSQPAVARMLSRLRAVDGVTRVSLSKSEKGRRARAQPATVACDGQEPADLLRRRVLRALRGARGLAPAADDAATASTVPVPTAVDGAAPGHRPRGRRPTGNSADGTGRRRSTSRPPTDRSHAP